MPIYTKPRIRTGQLLDEFEAPKLDVLAAVAEEALARSPVKSFQSARALLAAERDEESPFLSAHDARERVLEAGVDLRIDPTGNREALIDLKIETKREEMIRNDTLRRSPGGLGFGAQKFGVALVASFFDAGNIASGLVPVVGPARYSAMIARAGGVAGRTAVRAGVGAAEGVVGAALVEPIVAFAAHKEQADYDNVDSLLNIAFGTVFGGGLHVIGGGAIDVASFYAKKADASAPPDSITKIVAKLGQEDREWLLRIAATQMKRGVNINVDPILRAATARLRAGAAAIPRAVDADVALPAWLVRAKRRIEGVDDGDEFPRGTPRPAEETPGGAARRVEEAEADIVDAIKAAKEIEARLIPDDELVDLQLELKDIIDEVSDLRKSPKRRAAAKKHFARRREEIAAKINEQMEARRLLDEVITRVDPARLEGAGAGRQGAAPRPAGSEPDPGTLEGILKRRGAGDDSVRIKVDGVEFRAAAEKTYSPEGEALHDPAASRRADEDTKAIIDDEDMPEVTMEEAVEGALDEATRMGVEEDVNTELSKFDEIDTLMESRAKAVRALASCQLRRGA